MFTRLQSTASISTTTSATAVGHFATSRIANAGYEVYQGGSFLGTVAQAVAASVSGNFIIGGVAGLTFNTGTVGAFHFGASLSAREVVVLEAALRSYMRSVGAA